MKGNLSQNPDSDVPHDGNDAQGRRKQSLSTMIVMVSTLASRLLGFVRAAVFSAVFGGEGIADVYSAVWVIPNNLRMLLAEGALSTAFVPVLTKSLVNDPSRKNAQVLIKTLMSFQVMVLIPFLALCIVFANPIVGFILSFTGEKQQLAVDLFSWMISYILLVSISSVLMAILNTHDKFAVPALAPLAFSITTIVSIFLFSQQLSVMAMAIGVLAGGILQIAIMVPSYRKIGYRLGFSFSFRHNDEFRQVLRLWLPVIVTASITAINEQIAVYFASSLPPGSAAAMTNAILFWQLPFGIFSASITTVLFPRMAKQIALEQTRELKETVLHGVRMLMYFLIPSAILLMLLGHEIIGVALQRGAFRPEHTDLAASVLWAYSLGLFTVGAMRFLQRFFYARHDFKTPLFSGILVVVLDISLSIVFIKMGMGVTGLAYANTIASVLGVGWLFFFIRCALGGLQLTSMLISLLKTLLSCLPMIAGVLLAQEYCGTWWRTEGLMKNLVFLIACGLWSIGTIMIMYRILRIEALDFLLRKKRG